MKTVRLLSGGAAQGLVEALRPAFEASAGCRIESVFGAVGAMRGRLLTGEPADLLILSRNLIEALVRAGHVVGSSTGDIGAVQTAIAVRQGDPLPSVGDQQELRAALDAADEIHFPDPEQATAGIHFTTVMKGLGIAPGGRLRTAPNGATAMRALATSTARRPIGCTQATGILSTPAIAYVAPLPPGCDLATTYTGGITTGSTVPAEATALLGLLADKSARELRRRLGFL